MVVMLKRLSCPDTHSSVRFLSVSLTLIIILLSVNTKVFPQQNNNGFAIYNAVSNYSFENLESNEQKEVLKNLFEESNKTSKTEFKLIFKENQSVFFPIQKLNEGNKIDLVSVKAKITGSFFTDLRSGDIIQAKDKFGQAFLIKSKLENFKWELTNESAIINSYKCYKAILTNDNDKKNKTFAWYAPEININHGPMGNCGLPGLIIVLKKDIFIYTLKLIKFELSSKDESKLIIPKKGKEVSVIEYDSIYKIMRKRKDELDSDFYQN
jgi:GLPGLI family protein